MRIEDLEHWNVDRLKKECVRLSEKCEEKQREILDLKSAVNNLQKDLADAKDYNELTKKTTQFSEPTKEWYESRHQDDCMRINQLTVTINILVDMLAKLRENKGLS